MVLRGEVLVNPFVGPGMRLATGLDAGKSRGIDIDKEARCLEWVAKRGCCPIRTAATVHSAVARYTFFPPTGHTVT